MTTEQIVIEIIDKVSPAIATKIIRISQVARTAESDLQKLQSALNGLNGSKLVGIVQNANAAATAINNVTLSAQRLATEQQRTAAATAKATEAQNKAQAALIGVSTAQQRLAEATTKTTTAQTNAATAAARLTGEQSRTAKAASDAAAASDRAALAALRLKQAQDQQAASAARSASSLGGFVKAAAAATAAFVASNSLIQAGDAYTVLNNKLQNVTTSQEQVNTLMGRVFDLANETRSSVDATATAFTRFDRAMKIQGKSQEDSLRLTETVNKALKIGGATAGEAASALLQLSQAFNAGKLQGDEFRAVSENMPMVLDAVAKVMGKTESQVKSLSSQGKITAAVMIQAFTSIQKQVDETYAKTVPTVAESLTVLNNQFVRYIGQIDKATGFTKAVSSIILALGRNLDVVSVVAVAAGAAIMVAFGPALIGVLSTATRAVIGFTAALASNPIGLVIVAIATATAALVVFGDRIFLTEDKLVNLQDAAKTTWSYIKDGAVKAGDVVKAGWTATIETVNQHTNGWGTKFETVMSNIGTYVKASNNATIGAFVGAYNAIIVAWNNLPVAMQLIFAKIVNGAASAVEGLVNSWQVGLRTIADGVGNLAPEVAEKLNAALAASALKLPRMQLDEPAKDMAAQIGKAFDDAFSKDYVGDAAESFMERARKIAEARQAAEKAANLRGTGTPADTGPDEKATKEAIKRATALAKVNLELDNELNRLTMLRPERDAQAKMDEIEEALLGKRIKLNADEKKSINEKIIALSKAKDVQAAMDAQYDEAAAPLRNYTATVAAAQNLLNKGAISTAQYIKNITRAAQEYQNAIDPLKSFNTELDQQIELFGLLPKERAVEQQVMQISNQLLAQGTVLTHEQTQAMRERLRLAESLSEQSQEENSIYAATIGVQEKYKAQLAAINKLLKEQVGFGKDEAFKALLSTDVGQFLENTTEGLNLQAKQWETYYNRLDDLRKQNLISEETAAEARINIWTAQLNSQLSQSSDFFSQIAQMSDSSNSALSSIGKAAGGASKTFDTVKKGVSLVSNVSKMFSAGGISNATTGLANAVGFFTGGASTASAVAGANAAAALGGDAIATFAGLTGNAGIGLGGALSGIGSAMPYIGMAIAAYQLLSTSFKGEKRSGGTFGYDGKDVNFLHGPSGGTGGNDELVKTVLSTTVSSINSLYDTVGSKLRVSNLIGGFEQSEKGRGGVMAGLTTNTGIKIGQDGSGSNYKGTYYSKNFSQSPTIEGAVADFQTIIKQTTIEAWQLALPDLPTSISDLIKDKTASELTGAEADGIIAAVNALVTTYSQYKAVVTDMPEAFKALKELSFDAAVSLVNLSGGIEKFVTDNNSYYSNFYTESEKMGTVFNDLNSTFSALGYDTVPATREAMRDIVDALDLTTESGRMARAALIGASEQLVNWIDFNSREVNKKNEENEIKQAAATKKANDRILSIINAAANAAQTALDTANANADKAVQIYTDAVNKERKKVQDAYTESSKALDVLNKAASDSVALFTGLGDRIKSSKASLLGEYDAEMQRAQAQQLVADALLGNIGDIEALSEAVGILGQKSRKNFTTLADEQTDLLKTANDLYALGGAVDTRLSIEKSTLDAINKQIKKEQENFDKEMLRYDDMISIAEDQLSEARGNKNIVMSIDEAAQNISQTLKNLAAANAAKPVVKNPLDTMTPTEKAIYDAYGQTNTPLDEDGFKFWTDAVNNGFDLAKVVAQIIATNTVKQATSGSATGGGGAAPTAPVVPTMSAAELEIRNAYASSGQVADPAGVSWWLDAYNNGTPMSALVAEIDRIGKANGSYASGLYQVPYDGLIARLHKNERVLTEDEAREYNAREGSLQQSADDAAVSVKLDRLIELTGLSLAMESQTKVNVESLNKTFNQMTGNGRLPMPVSVSNVVSTLPIEVE